MRLTSSTSFWQRLKRGPWPEEVVRRLLAALDDLARRLRCQPGVQAIILFGSYARGDYGRSSDVDLLVLVAPTEDDGQSEDRLREQVVAHAVEVETRCRLPMHLAPLVARADAPQLLGPDLLHDLGREGVILYAQASALPGLQPTDLAPWTVVRYSAADLPPEQRVRLSRLLFGRQGRPGIVRPPALRLGRGALLLSGPQVQAVRETLDTLGVVYDAVPVWRPA